MENTVPALIIAMISIPAIFALVAISAELRKIRIILEKEKNTKVHDWEK